MISLPKKIWFVDRFCVWEYKPFQLSKDGFLLCIVATELFGFVTGAGMTLELMGELGDEMDHKMFGGVGSWKGWFYVSLGFMFGADWLSRDNWLAYTLLEVIDL